MIARRTGEERPVEVKGTKPTFARFRLALSDGTVASIELTLA
jgi:hypothetical protein